MNTPITVDKYYPIQPNGATIEIYLFINFYVKPWEDGVILTYKFARTEVNHLSSHSLIPSQTQMAPNGTAVHTGLTPGHFLFTSESVGEGHPGMLNLSCLLCKFLILD